MSKAIELLGSCHCKAIKYSLKSSTPTPYSSCYCGVCRKLNGGGGSCIAITGDTKTFQAEGTQHLGIYKVCSPPQSLLVPGLISYMSSLRMAFPSHNFKGLIHSSQSGFLHAYHTLIFLVCFGQGYGGWVLSGRKLCPSSVDISSVCLCFTL